MVRMNVTAVSHRSAALALGWLHEFPLVDGHVQNIPRPLFLGSGIRLIATAPRITLVTLTVTNTLTLIAQVPATTPSRWRIDMVAIQALPLSSRVPRPTAQSAPAFRSVSVISAAFASEITERPVTNSPPGSPNDIACR